jgi:DNA-binding transcriptional ArsR family regulator
MNDSISTDAVFRALADPSRRQILDLLKARPGMNVSDLTEHFEFSRFAVMKHLRVLEEASLVVRRRDGKSKRLYLNAIPIQTIYDRWISQYSARWASSLTSLKYRLEEESTMVKTDLEQVYVMFIRTSPARLWNAITSAELTKHYFHDSEVESDWKVGSRIDYYRVKDGERSSALTGEILEIELEKKLVHSFDFPGNDDPVTRVSYEIEEIAEGTVKLTLVHDGFEEENETYKGTSEGWWPIVNGLKTYLETGSPLRMSDPDC